MDTRLAPILLVALATLAATPAHPAAAGGGPTLTTELVVGGLSSPVFLTHAPDDPDRLFLLERAGLIRIVRRGALLAQPFLDIRSLVTMSSEGGLLGLAFHPDFEANGRFCVYYTRSEGLFAFKSVLAEYETSALDGDVADPASARILLVIDQETADHNGGWIGFGPRDGYLYLPLGDGGLEETGPAFAQDLTNQPLGKILPIDVDGDGDVDFTDLVALLSGWGACGTCPADLDGDGDVGFGDLLILLAGWT